MAEHAILSASSAHRWLICTRSARWEAEFPDTQSESAAEGTVAHALAEHCVKARLRGKRIVVPKAIKENQYYCQDMLDHCKDYAEYVMLQYKTFPKAELFTEIRVDYSDFAPKGFGTADCLIISDDTIVVIDFKYGRHVLVEVNDNPQLKLYALGSLKMDVWGTVKNVTTCIFQPRMENIDSASYKTNDLLNWAEIRVKKAAKMAWRGEGDFVPGDHCRFCRCKFRCEAYRDTFRPIVSLKEREAEGYKLTDEDISHILDKVDEYISWVNGIKEYALSGVVAGDFSIPGYKLVEGRSTRKITNSEQAIEILKNAGYAQEEILNSSLKGITELERKVGKEKLSTLLSSVISKPAGKPTLVSETDPRPVYTPTNFTAIEEAKQ